MLSTIELVVAGLSTGNKVGLAAVGGAFIVFALVSSFVLPLRSPNFPGRALGWYVALSVLFFVAMISAVLVFGKEKKEAAAEPGTTTAAATATAPAAAPSAADLAAGKAVFKSQGCASCHTLKAAGATATVGPDLDKLKQYAAQANRGSLTAFIKESIVTPNAYVQPGFPKSLMPQTFGTSIPPDKLDQLGGFLAHSAT
jgi:mono/diheme cytochrome c family protein